jgi:uncharacterized membrane protein YuzA (DUF378 family)
MKGGENMWYEKTAMTLAAIGAINWGLHALEYNLVELLLGSWPIVVDIVYYVIALCGIWALVKVFK